MSRFGPEPPDGSRVEWEHCTDVYAAWRDDDSARRAGWRHGDGGKVWCMYGSSIAFSWADLNHDFDNAPAIFGVRLLVHSQDVGKHALWSLAVDGMRRVTDGVDEAQILAGLADLADHLAAPAVSRMTSFDELMETVRGLGQHERELILAEVALLERQADLCRAPLRD